MAKTAAKSGKSAKPAKAGKPTKASVKVASKSKPKPKPVKKAAPKAKPAKKAAPKKISKPVIKKSVAKKPVIKKPVAKKPPVKKQPIKKAVQKKSAPKKPVAKKAVIKKPVAKKPIAKKIVVKKVVAKKPELKKAPVKKAEVKKMIKTPQVVVKPLAKKSYVEVVKKGDVELKKAVAVKAEDKHKKIEKTLKPEKSETTVKVEKEEKIERIAKVGKAEDKGDSAIEKKLRALINLQQIDSQIDKIRIVRGELPLEVQDLEDEIAGIQTRIENYANELSAVEEAIAERKNAIKQCQVLIKKYETQQSNVRNNREYDSLSKEIEFQNLEIQLCEKRIKEHKTTLDAKKVIIETSQKQLDEKQHDVDLKKAELTDIVAETEKEESVLLAKSIENQKIIEDRLLSAYKKIRMNARNGLAVVIVERDACGGCFNKIPPQRQLDIRIHKKIIVCEYCGRILVDPEIVK